MLLTDILTVWPPRENVRSMRARLWSLVHPVKVGNQVIVGLVDITCPMSKS